MTITAPAPTEFESSEDEDYVPSLAEVHELLGHLPEPYDVHFLRSGEPVQQRASHKINAIVEAAEALLADPRVGLENFSLTHVFVYMNTVMGVTISIGGIYRYFKRPEHLLNYVWPHRPPAPQFQRFIGPRRGPHN